jgi:hypothetical protein
LLRVGLVEQSADSFFAIGGRRQSRGLLGEERSGQPRQQQKGEDCFHYESQFNWRRAPEQATQRSAAGAKKS